MHQGRALRWLLSVSALLFLCLVPAWLNAQDADGAGRRRLFVPGQLLVRYRAGVGSGNALRPLARFRAHIAQRFQKLRMELVELEGEDKDKVFDALADLKQSDEVEFAEPNYCYYPTGTQPDDSSFATQWSLYNAGSRSDIHAPEAWDFTRGDPDQVIAIVDTGCQVDHPDLAANIWTNPGEIAGNGIDDDGNGYIDDIHGWDFFNNDSTVYDPADGDQHGTHVAGIIAAAANNGRGVAGVNWQAKIMVLKFIGPDYGSVAGAIAALNYAKAKGVKILNNSWGGGGLSMSLKRAIEDSGALFVAAAGNDAKDTDASTFYPAGYDLANVLAVASSDRYDALSSFSSYGGRSVHIAAPGTSIYSTVPSGSYGYMSGTSMATPHASGVAGLLNALRERSPAELRNLMLNSADRLPQFATRNQCGGRLNAYRALTLADEDPHLVVSIFKPSAKPSGESAVPCGQAAMIGVRVGYGAHVASGASVTADFDNGQSTIVLTEDSPGIYTGPWTPESAVTRDTLITVTATAAGLLAGSDVLMVYTPVPTYREELVAHEMVGATTGTALQGDDDTYTYTLPFSFSFYNRSYSSVYVSCNGYLDFRSSLSDFTNSTNELIGNTRLAVLWDDLVLNDAGAGIYVSRPSSDSVAFRWVGKTMGYNRPVDAEIVLYRDGRMQLNYGAGNENTTSTVGVSNGEGTDYVISQYNGSANLNTVQSVRIVRNGVSGGGDPVPTPTPTPTRPPSNTPTPTPPALTPTPTPTPQPQGATIRGIVRKRGVPVGNVTVKMTGRSSSGGWGWWGRSSSRSILSVNTRTDSSGFYDSEHMQAGSYTVSVNQRSVGRRSYTVTLTGDQVREVNFNF